ncbi:hypothetical protein F511_29608 [Dorcoceras hygrometricum]|uniref:Uncharacterized protein n=1 Tax=Dorcoceras hygrometricum TaxID=472368 RepID=A0A2Z7CKA6_9LAMI|nr:hypothetical protein F511_29608 [Dorcoceras hygrometricum]
MSGRRSRQPSSSNSRITDEQIIELVSKLHQLLPEIRNSTRRSSKPSSSNSRITDEQIIELVSKLHQLLPEIRNSTRRSSKLIVVLEHGLPTNPCVVALMVQRK